MLCAFTIVLSLILGGGTRSGFLSDAILELAALPLFLFGLWRALDVRFSPPGVWALRWCLAFALAPLLQLIPLPADVWTALPSREPVVESYQLIGVALPAAPLSVAPNATWLALLSLIPPLAVFLGVIQLDLRERRLLSLTVLAFGMAGVFLGLIQVSQGEDSALRFYAVTNPNEAVGFFANRNHYAAFLYTLTVFASAWAVDAAARISSAPPGQAFAPGPLAGLALSFTVLVALVGAQAMARSRAGLGLTMLAMFGAFAMASRPAGAVRDRHERRWSNERRRSRGITANRVLAMVVVVGVMFAVQFALYRVMERFSSDTLADSRLAFARNTLAAARAFMPFGSGLGTFTSVYGLFDSPEDVLPDTYVNRAHNDILEYWLETGAAGVALMCGFAAWLTHRAGAVWRKTRRRPVGETGVDLGLKRAASLAILLIGLHSVVDYPLRTAAMAALMAFSCALLIDPPGAGSESAGEGRSDMPRPGQRRH